ncbi:MAG: 30S ribosomal protein S27ae [Candidatus Bathyarchaeia archaeon]
MSKNNRSKRKKPISSYYKIEDGKIKRTLPTCDRCGPGYFMADHGNRYSCGHCGFTRYKTAKNPNKASAREDYSSD